LAFKFGDEMGRKPDDIRMKLVLISGSFVKQVREVDLKERVWLRPMLLIGCQCERRPVRDITGRTGASLESRLTPPSCED